MAKTDTDHSVNLAIFPSLTVNSFYFQIMKSTFSFFAFALLILLALSGQAGDKIGIRAGYQMASFQVDGSMPEGTNNLNSFYVGIFKENKLIPLLSLGYGLDFMQNGAEYADNNKYVINYLSIPLYVKAKVGPVFGLTGLGANFKLSDKITNASNTSTPSDYLAKDFDLPLFIGGGFNFLMFSIEARYNWGMIPVNDVTNVKNHYLQVGACIHF